MLTTMSSLLAALANPVALDGDSGLGNNAAIAILGITSMVGGYLFLAALWYFVFRRSPEERSAEREAQQARERAVLAAQPVEASGLEEGHEPAAVHGRRLKIDHSPTPRFRRR